MVARVRGREQESIGKREIERESEMRKRERERERENDRRRGRNKGNRENFSIDRVNQFFVNLEELNRSRLSAYVIFCLKIL
jgi:hypothetical protein